MVIGKQGGCIVKTRLRLVRVAANNHNNAPCSTRCSQPRHAMKRLSLRLYRISGPPVRSHYGLLRLDLLEMKMACIYFEGY